MARAKSPRKDECGDRGLGTQPQHLLPSEPGQRASSSHRNVAREAGPRRRSPLEQKEKSQSPVDTAAGPGLRPRTGPLLGTLLECMVVEPEDQGAQSLAAAGGVEEGDTWKGVGRRED